MIEPALFLSVWVSVVSTAFIAVLGTALGYFLAKARFTGKELLDSLITLPMVLPPTVTGYYLILLLGRRGIIGHFIYELTGWSVAFTWQAAVIASTVVALPLMVKSARAAIEGVDPRLESASSILGKSRWETFIRVTLPLSARGLMAGLVLSFIRALGEFGATLMLAGNIPGKTQTMPLAIFEAVVAGEDRRAQALALILTAVSFAVVYGANRLNRKAYS